MDVIPSEMFRGHLDTIVLLSLVNDDKHTNQIRDEIEERSQGQFELKQGTFYSCLQRIVKQGYVTEYRATSEDGVRRKFLQLTEKGKNYIDDNKDKWEVSRSVVNTLLETPEKPKPKVANDDDNRNDSIVLPAEPIDIDSALKDFLNSPDTEVVKKHEEPKNNDVVSDNVEIIDLGVFAQNTKTAEAAQPVSDAEPKQAEVTSYEDAPNYEKARTPIVTPLNDPNITPESYEITILTGDYSNINTVQEIQDVAEEAVTNDAQIEPEVIPEVEQTTIEEEPILEPTSEINQPKYVEPEAPSVQELVKEVETTYSPNENDLLDSVTTIRHNYKDVLQRLFPTKESPKKPDYDERVRVYEPGTDIRDYFADDEPVYEKYEKEPEIERPEPTTIISTPHKKSATRNVIEVEEPSEPVVPIVTSDEDFDFSDIKSLAKVEGFKVSIASGKTKRTVNSILANKLSAVSALIYYLIALCEIGILAYFTAPQAQLTLKPFVIFALVLGIFPLTSLIIYFIDPKRKVASIPTMKSVIELCIVVMLNLVLIMIVFSILAEVDFANTAHVLRYVVYPSIIILNVPIYFIVKYLNLENRKFYS